jgi:hypothetical protein
MKLDDILKTALDEMRMQMLAAEVLFGFQFASGFQSEFDRLSPLARYADATALILMVVAIALLIAVPSQHRLVEKGEATPRLYRAATLFACIALAPIALALACDFLVVTDYLFGAATGWIAAATVLVMGAGAWYGAALVLRHYVPRREQTMTAEKDGPTPLHSKIEQMLTEARVVLPGAQALLGFQFIAILTQAFGELPHDVRLIHFTALCAVALAIVLLITPAAIHRLTFDGSDRLRFHTIGSWLVTAALVPLAIGIACDLYVAVIKMLGDTSLALTVAISGFVLLVGLWYALPLAIAHRFQQTSGTAARQNQ